MTWGAVALLCHKTRDRDAMATAEQSERTTVCRQNVTALKNVKTKNIQKKTSSFGYSEDDHENYCFCNFFRDTLMFHFLRHFQSLHHQPPCFTKRKSSVCIALQDYLLPSRERKLVSEILGKKTRALDSDLTARLSFLIFWKSLSNTTLESHNVRR